MAKPKFNQPWENFRINKSYSGIIKKIKDYGYFIDIGAPETGLLLVQNIENAGLKLEHYSIGDCIDVCIKSFDSNDKKMILDIVKLNLKE